MKLLLLSLVVAGTAGAQGWVARGYQMSAMTYDSLGLHVTVEEQGSRGGREFQRLLVEGCANILERNGIRCIVTSGGQRVGRYPCVVLDLTILPVLGDRSTFGELYYGTLSFNREVMLTIASKQLRGIGSTWSMTLGGQAQSRFEIVSDIEERLKDFVIDYLKINSAIWIWRGR